MVSCVCDNFHISFLSLFADEIKSNKTCTHHSYRFSKLDGTFWTVNGHIQKLEDYHDIFKDRLFLLVRILK